MRTSAAVLIVAWLAGAAPLAAQPSGNGSSDPKPVDATKLGVDLDRIGRKLRQAEVRQEQTDSPLKLDYRIEVFGVAPPIDIFEGFDLSSGAVQYGAPTHNDIVQFLTPKEFRSPPASVHTAVFWAAQKVYEKMQKHNCEQELKKYREQVEQGLNVSPPACAQPQP